ncbi:MAG: hypothetical protein IJ190_12530 [Prevotella sp.]|nr:hypothetical protein [Prevotella sp.]
MRKILFYIVLVLTCVACSSKDDVELRKPAKRTVMVYVAAENTLSGNAQSDINEMIQGVKSISKYDNLIVFVDRAGSQESPFIIRLQDNDKHPADTIKKYNSDFYSSDPDKMKEVLGWIMSQYPADDYGLVLWGHGNGWVIMNDSVSTQRAIAVDSGDNRVSDNGLWMNIPSLRVALNALPHPFKFIFADCCNMQNIEVAYELKDVTEYYIASPAGIPGEGAPYQTIIPDLFLYDDVQMYTKTCDDYNALTDNENGHLPVTAIRTKDLPSLVIATKTALQTIDPSTVNTDGLIYYYSYRVSDPNEHVMYDMKDFLLRHAEPAAYQQWEKALEQSQTIAYKKISTKWQVLGTLVFDFEVTEERFGGVSMFVPLERYENTLINYNEGIKKMAWYHAVGWSELGW